MAVARDTVEGWQGVFDEAWLFVIVYMLLVPFLQEYLSNPILGRLYHRHTSLPSLSPIHYLNNNHHRSCLYYCLASILASVCLVVHTKSPTSKTIKHLRSGICTRILSNLTSRIINISYQKNIEYHSSLNPLQRPSKCHPSPCPP